MAESVVVSVIDVWKKFGIFDFILPFMLVFGIVYGILERTQLFGKNVGKSVNAIIAFTIAMTSTLTSWFIGFLTGFLPYVSTISIIVVSALMLILMFVKEGDETLFKNKYFTLIGAVVVTTSIVVVLFSMLGNYIPLDFSGVISSIGLSASDIIGIGFFIGFLLVLYFLGRGFNSGGGSGNSS